MQNASNFEAPRNLNFACFFAAWDEVPENSSEQENLYFFSFNDTIFYDADIDITDNLIMTISKIMTIL